MVYLLDTRDNDGTLRAKIALRDNAKPKGWVTLARNGQLLIDVEGGIDPAVLKAHVNQAGESSGTGSMKKGLANSTNLTELMELQNKLADEQELICQKRTDLPSKLGEALIQKTGSVSDYVKRWDVHDAGAITKMEFRKSIRDLGMAGTDGSAEIDAVFDWIDTDHGGTLDAKEMTAAFQKIKDAAVKLKAKSASAAEKATVLRAHAALTQKAIEATMEFEAAEARNPLADAAIDVRLGMLLVKRGLKVGDLTRAWDSNGNGTIDRDEFRHSCKTSGLEATDEEVNTFFTQMDTDSSGTFSMDELKAVLLRATEATSKAAELEKAHQKRAVELRKAAKQAQVAAYREAQADEEARRIGEAAAKDTDDEMVTIDVAVTKAQKSGSKKGKKAKATPSKGSSESLAEVPTAGGTTLQNDPARDPAVTGASTGVENISKTAVQTDNLKADTASNGPT